MNTRLRAISLAIICMCLASCAGRPPATLGVTDAALAKCKSKPNCVSSFSETKQHQIESFELAMPVEQAWPLIMQAIRANQAAKLISSSGTYLHAEYKSKTMGFIDDLELLTSTDSKRIYVRSASRIGYSDRGVNRKRVEALRSELLGLGLLQE